ncbi:MAG: hypothetical protein K2X81_03980 [Candidatus Obscuribacterales bacterium]|nr:hypothetical protein [Candidatus Obscuribacterales bacterium]
MEKKKTPQEKKRLSYDRDRRYTYGNNQKAARTAVPRNKRFNNRSRRKNVNQLLQPGTFDVEQSNETTRSLWMLYTATRWRKWTSGKLKFVLRYKLLRRLGAVPGQMTVLSRMKFNDLSEH